MHFCPTVSLCTVQLPRTHIHPFRMLFKPCQNHSCMYTHIHRWTSRPGYCQNHSCTYTHIHRWTSQPGYCQNHSCTYTHIHRWTSRPGYGKAPVYLRRNKQRIAAEREQLETYLKMRFDPVCVCVCLCARACVCVGGGGVRQQIRDDVCCVTVRVRGTI